MLATTSEEDSVDVTTTLLKGEKGEDDVGDDVGDDEVGVDAI